LNKKALSLSENLVISEIKNDKESGVVLGSVMRRFSVKMLTPGTEINVAIYRNN
jgi:hypothetical protein